MPSSRANGEAAASGLPQSDSSDQALLNDLGNEFFSIVETAVEPLEKSLQWIALAGQKATVLCCGLPSHAGRRKSKCLGSLGDAGESEGGDLLELPGKPASRNKGVGIFLPLCIFVLIVACIVGSSVLAVYLYKTHVSSQARADEDGQDHSAESLGTPLAMIDSSKWAQAVRKGYEEKKTEEEEILPAGKKPWWETLHEKKKVTAQQAVIDAVKILAGQAAGPQFTELECWAWATQRCNLEETRKGPPPHLLRPVFLSRADLALFRSVTRFKENREVIAESVENRTIAFLYLTRGPMPLAPFWELFFKGHEGRYKIYVHANPGFTYSRNDSPLFRKSLIPSEQVLWGSPTVVSAERRLLAHALSDPSNHRFILLSESCSPIRSFQFVWDYLFSTNLSFVESLYDPSPWGQHRYTPGMQPEVQPSQWRKGGQWWSMGRKHAYMAVEDRDVWQKMQKYCRGDKWHRHCCSDEHYFQTLLYIKDGAGLANRTVTMADWSTRSSHPKTFYAWNINYDAIKFYQDLTVITEGISIVDKRRSCHLPGEDYDRMCFLFLRKINSSAVSQLMDMADQILAY